MIVSGRFYGLKVLSLQTRLVLNTLLIDIRVEFVFGIILDTFQIFAFTRSLLSLFQTLYFFTFQYLIFVSC